MRMFITMIWFISASAFADVLTFGVLGDAGVWNEKTRSLRTSMKKNAVSSLILPGDNLYFGEYPDVWSHWGDFTFDVVAIGNHTQGYEAEVAYFRMPDEFYVYRPHPDVLFIVLNSDNEETVVRQGAWLKKQLAAAREQHIFVVMHHPPYTVSERHTWYEKEAFHRAVRPLLQRFSQKISAIIVGHDHLASLVMIDELPMIVSGATWQTLPGPIVDYRDGDTRVKTAWMYHKNPHWVRLDINTETNNVWLNFVDASLESVTCTVKIHGKSTVLKSRCHQPALSQ